MEQNSSPFRWAYVGCGSIAKNTAVNIKFGDHRVTAVYSRNFEKAQAFASKHGARAYKSFEEAVTADDVDAVYIATPHNSHMEYSVRALSLGKPVLCEKPVAVNAGQLEKIIDAAKENNVYFCEAMWTWFSDVAIKVKQWINDGRIGEIISVQMNYAFPGVMQSKNSRLLMPETAGGALLDIGVYPITYCYNLFGMPKSIVCDGVVQNGIDVKEKITLGYEGFECKLNISLTELKESCVIKGKKGQINIPMFHFAALAFLKSEGKREVFRGKTDYLTQFNRVAGEIKENKTMSDYIPFSATKSCMLIMDECRKQMGLVYPFENAKKEN